MEFFLILTMVLIYFMKLTFSGLWPINGRTYLFLLRFFFGNGTAINNLQSSKNPLSFAYNFCKGLTFASEFFSARALTQ